MTDAELLDRLKEMGNRLCTAAFVLQHAAEEDSVRECVVTLLEDNHQTSQEIMHEYCAHEEVK